MKTSLVGREDKLAEALFETRPMTLQTSVLGSLPRSIEVLNQFRDYDNVYRNPTALAVLEEEAREIILKQENLAMAILNDGEIQKSGYFPVLYDCFD